MDSYFQHSRPELVAHVDADASSVLDLGCGEGNISAAIRSRCEKSEIWGVEVVPEVARRAQENSALDKVICGDIEDVLGQLPEAYFSHVVAGDVLEHLADPWTVLERIRSCMKPRGKMICSIPNIRNFSLFFTLFVGGSFAYRDSGVMDRDHLRFFARKDVLRLFEQAGFSEISIGPVRPKKNLVKRLSRTLFGDLVIKGFLVTARAS